MARPPVMPPEEKAKLVLHLLSGELSVSQAARQAGVSEQAIGNWKRQFIAAGSQGLEGGDRQSSERERKLNAQITELKTALGEVYVQLRARRAAVDFHAVPSQTSKPYGVTAGSAFRGSAASSGYREVLTPAGD
ncbi:MULTISPECIES: helix-turn-helix domain-containing protein [Streptomyces]|uniref:Transposase n=1 Tax=Streptomyces mirabilis TaxID=68239 RepID=A0ABU3UNY5_9ACTN|nr:MULTISPECIES: helix-turn-helix domain-containing protein [Streptomyces]MCX4422561.1 transposase [Streptomyces mirabilis]MCX4610650.1 transposase [Streptomyces mirabilis]MCX5350864.1 transposase [Streptomyces mirabilis]MCZ1001030.1 transposase [Streptomyces mirabilis]MDU8995638.1 transposase [Streptomyces mirabilis]